MKEDKKYKKKCTGKSLRRVKNPQKSGAGADDIYQPQLEWFKRADIFLENVVSNRTTTSNLVHTFVLLHNSSYFYYIHF